MKSLAPLAATLAVFATAANAAPRDAHPVATTSPARYTPAEIPFVKYTLPNGLTLIVQEDHSRPVAAVSVWYHVGSQNEVAGRTGFAHLYEHLMFNGSEHADDDWFTYMSAIGATNLNGTTAFDRTNFFETVPIGALDRTLWLESDRMGHLLGAMTQAKLDEQRGVVENEKRQQENSPYGAIPATLAAATYPIGHPYSWLPIGSVSDLKAASLDDVKTWFRTWYGAGNATVVIAGDVTPAAMRDKVERYFGFVPRGPALQRNDRWVARRTGERRATVQVAAPEAPVIQTWNVAAFGTRDAALLDIAAWALGGGQASRLYRRLVVEDRIATNVGVSNESRQLGGQFSITASPKPGIDPGLVERTAREELARFVAEGPTAAELDRFKAATYADGVSLAENIEAKGALLAENALYTGDPASYRRTQAWQYGATVADVRRVAADWLSDGAVVLTATPLGSTTTVADVDRSHLPPLGPPAAMKLAPPRDFALSNGLRVALVERHSAPTIAMQLIFRTGTKADGNATPPMTGDLATQLAVKGTPSRSETTIEQEETRLGVGIGWAAAPEALRYTFNGLTATLAPALDLYADMLINPSFPRAVFDRERAIAAAELDQRRSTPRGKLSLVEDRLLYGPAHPYAAVPTPASLAKLQVADLSTWYRRWVRPDNATLLIVGDVTEAQIRPMLEQRLSAWRTPASPLPTATPLPPVSARTRPAIYLLDQPGAEQSVIQIDGPAPLRTDPGFEAMDLAANVLGGGFLSRLNMNLREDKHWSYGAGARLTAQRDTGTFDVSTSVQTDKTAAALKEIDRELRGIVSTRKPSDAEVRRAQNDAVLTMTGGLGTASGVAGYYGHAIRYELGNDYWNGRAARLEAFTPDQIAAAAVRLVRPDQLDWIVVGDLSRIEADIRALDIGAVSVIDADGGVIR